MKARLPSFGELLDSLRETEMDTSSVARYPLHHHQQYRQLQLRTPSPEWMAGSSGVSIVVSSASPDDRPFAVGNAQMQSTLPRRGRVARYQPYLSTGPAATRRSSLPGDVHHEDSSRVANICLIKRHKSTMFEDGMSRQPTSITVPSAPPISSLLRRGGSSPVSPASPNLTNLGPHSHAFPSGPVSLPTLPSFNFKPFPPHPSPPSPNVIPSPNTIGQGKGNRGHRGQSHSRDSSSGSMASVSSSMSVSTDEEGNSFSSISGGSLASAKSTSQRLRGRPYRVWTASGYRYPPLPSQ